MEGIVGVGTIVGVFVRTGVAVMFGIRDGEFGGVVVMLLSLLFTAQAERNIIEIRSTTKRNNLDFIIFATLARKVDYLNLRININNNTRAA
ncbi:MAG: hypothetical protein AB9897_02550 [Anaerolineaceae bacterium]